MEDWAEIRRLYLAERMSIKAIAKKLHLARNTVRNAVRSVQPPRYVRAGSGSIVDEVEPRIRALLKEFPDMPATVIAERIGWGRSMTVLKERVRLLRPVYAPTDPSSRTTYEAGEVGQCDLWFPPAPIPLGHGQVGSGKTTPPVLVLTAGYSRFLAATMIPTRNAEDLVLGQWAVLRQLGGVPRLLVWDGEGGVGRYGGPNPKLTPQFTALRGMLGTRFYICKPNDPETKGLTERNNGFLETSFLPGRRFTGPADFNAQLAGFLARANARARRALQGACANDRIGADRAAMGPLPPIDIATIGWRHSVVLPRDYYVRLDTCDYSAHPSAVGQRVEVIADLDVVRIRRGAALVGEHERCWARQQTITDPEHRTAADALRQAFQDRGPGGRGAMVTEVAERDLSAYDRAFGLDDEGQAA
ncbi:IS21-like element ISMbo1 family transposase [Luedemannella helvata]|uniref:IS21-like element ISMbo1 family transposase n=1 Tax=Luedemannella helvata TaxID=349315 RepID=A0ABP4XC47_9ACTN